MVDGTIPTRFARRFSCYPRRLVLRTTQESGYFRKRIHRKSEFAACNYSARDRHGGYKTREGVRLLARCSSNREREWAAIECSGQGRFGARARALLSTLPLSILLRLVPGNGWSRTSRDARHLESQQRMHDRFVSYVSVYRVLMIHVNRKRRR